jgi:hypothetical protein
VAFWYLLITIGTLAAIINFTLGWVHRARLAGTLVRFAAGIISLALVAGVIVTKLVLDVHLPAGMELLRVNRYGFIAAGLFIGATLMLPSYVDRPSGETTAPTLQERAARPVNATVRMQNSDEWMN